MMNIIEAGSPSYLFKWRRFFTVMFSMIVVLIIILAFGYWRVQTAYTDRIVTIENIPSEYQTALVFGAGLQARGTPGPVLEDRLLTAIEAYQAGKVNYIVMSGDNSTANHNEVQAMVNVARREGLPDAVIEQDHSGIKTLASCVNARDVFNLDKVVLFTQRYHLKRALYICNELGVDAIGVDTARRSYGNQRRYSFREIGASISAWMEVKMTP